MRGCRNFAGVHETARVGGPGDLGCTALPAAVTSKSMPCTSPMACLTPGTAATLGTKEFGTSARSLLAPMSVLEKSDVARTTTLRLVLVRPIRSLNVAFSVSVKTRVPARKPTPRTTESPVSKSRTLCAKTLRSVARSIRLPVLLPQGDSSARELRPASGHAFHRSQRRQRGTRRGRHKTPPTGRASP